MTLPLRVQDVKTEHQVLVYVPSLINPYYQ